MLGSLEKLRCVLSRLIQLCQIKTHCNFLYLMQSFLLSLRLYGSRDFGMAVILSLWRTFFLIIVIEVRQTYQQNGRNLLVSKFTRYKNAPVVFSFPSSLHKVVSSSEHQVQSILCVKPCKVLVSWVVSQIFLKIFHKLDSVS